MEAHILLGRFQDAGLTCWLKDENVVTVNPLWTDATGGIKLMVAENQLEEATNLYAQYSAEKKEAFTCPSCNSGNIEYISSDRKAVNWLSVLLGFLFFSYALPVKTWRCFNCGIEFKEPKEKPGAVLE